MKLLFYDKFFESLIQLPKGIQKKVIEFQRKFRENSKSAGIHLEPISTFKDKSLRSARIDGTYRAIIKAPDTGNIHYLLWVDHHDKAYNWATNKVFQWNDQTQSIQVFTAPETIQVEEKSNIEEVSYDNSLFSDYSDEQLLKIGVPNILLPSIREISTLDKLEKIEKFIPTDVFENLFYLSDGANIEYLIHEVEEGKTSTETIDEQVSSINNQRSFIELTDDDVFNDILLGNLNKWKYYLHPSQRKLTTNDFSGSAKVSGGAGTGKTIAALHRAKYLIDKKTSSEKVLFTTFTKSLTENLKDLIKGLHIDEKNITIQNIDSLVFDLVKEYKIVPEGFKVFGISSVKNVSDIWDDLISSELTTFDATFLETEYEDVVLYNNVTSLKEYLRTSRIGRGKPITRKRRQEIWKYIELFQTQTHDQNIFYKEEIYNRLYTFLTNQEFHLFDYIIVDELQDFSNIELRVIRSLVPEKTNDLFMVGDPMQRIYNKKIVFSRVGINVRGKKSRRLRVNYRTTEEIKKLAISIIQDCHYDNFDGEEEEKAGYISLFHGHKPTYDLFKTKTEEISFVSKAINELIDIKDEDGINKYSYSDIAICARTKSGLKDFRNHLHVSEIPYTDQTHSSKESNKIRLLTFHSVKGLEFKHVFLVDVNNRTCPKIPFDFDIYSNEEKGEYLKNEKSLLYVAVSRAIENVSITGIGNVSEVIKLCDK